MVFEPWFQGRIPTTWRRAAVLHTRGAFAACDSISFFVTPSGDFAQVSRALAQFRRTLPARDSLSPDYDPSSVHCHQNTFDFGGTAKAPDPAASPKA
jgi:hypothetical protein